MLRFLNLIVVILFLTPSFSHSAQSLKQFLQKPKLVVVIVIDQFRADYLTRFQGSFLPAERGGVYGGFNYLMGRGAYFPFAHYNIFQAMTCPGHSMIMTGALPSESGISMNEWFDRESGSVIYCAADKDFGLSPRRLKTTTVSDELKNIDQKSKVVSLALKDRAAIMLGGLRPDLAIWMQDQKMNWETSRYYPPLPPWVAKVNEGFRGLENKNYLWKGVKRSLPFNSPGVLASPFGVEVTIDLALKAIEKEKLGQSQQTDFLLLSLSSHDLVGHQFGPNSPEMADMTKVEDQQVSRLLNVIARKVGLSSSLVVLTGDHGIPPAIDYLKTKKIDADRIDYLSLFKNVSAALDAKFGISNSGPWILAYRYFNFYLNPKVIAEKKLDPAILSREVKNVMKKQPGVAAVYTREDILEGKISPSIWSEALNNQYNPLNNGDLIMMPEPFHYEQSSVFVNHMTGYNYDTRVPLILAGAAFEPGVYSEYARVIDLAPTLSYILNLVAPPKSRGRVLKEALKNK